MTVRITLTSASGDTSLDVDLAQATARQEARLCDTCARAEAKTEETEDHRGLMDIEDAIALVALWAGEGE
jgi:hypothetical protein